MRQKKRGKKGKKGYNVLVLPKKPMIREKSERIAQSHHATAWKYEKEDIYIPCLRSKALAMGSELTTVMAFVAGIRACKFQKKENRTEQNKKSHVNI